MSAGYFTVIIYCKLQNEQIRLCAELLHNIPLITDYAERGRCSAKPCIYKIDITASICPVNFPKGVRKLVSVAALCRLRSSALGYGTTQRRNIYGFTASCLFKHPL